MDKAPGADFRPRYDAIFRDLRGYLIGRTTDLGLAQGLPIGKFSENVGNSLCLRCPET
jgi:hypothetical protein